MVNVIKRFFFGCKHEWKHIGTEYFYDQALSQDYGCVKCGKTTTVFLDVKRKWKFKQTHKGATFIDD